MQIETAKGTYNVGSQGVAGAGLGLGIAGTALGLGLLGGRNGLFGFNNGWGYNNDFGYGYGCHHGHDKTNSDTRVISALESEVSKLQSEKYTDQSILDFRDRLAALNEKVYGFIIDMDKRVSVMEASAPLREQLVQQQITCCCNATNAAIASLQNTVSSLTKTVIPADNVCPEPMAKYNSWTAPTTTATT